MRLSSRPPRKARASVASERGGEPTAPARPRPADAAPASGGQPLTAKRSSDPALPPRHPPPPRASSPGCRCAAPTRERADAAARPPSAGRAAPAWSITPASPAKKRTSLPCRSAGRPATSRASACASTLATRTAPSGNGRGCIARGPRRTAPHAATVLAAAGRRRLKSPDCGRHSTLQTSQSARSLTSSEGAAKVGATSTGHRQQHGPFVAVVDERTDRQPRRRRPLDRSGGRAGGQLPAQRGGQARVARVAPVGVPAGRMPDQEAEAERLAGRHAVRCMGHELGPHLVGLHRRALPCRQAGGQQDRPEPTMQDGHGRRDSTAEAMAALAMPP